MEKLTITEEHKRKFRLPEKAIGNWIVEAVSEEFVTLHKTTKDGIIRSNRGNNIYKMYSEIFAKITEKPKEMANTVEASLERKIAETFNVGTRKAKWLAELVMAMQSDPFGQQAMGKVGGEMKLAEIAITDTDPNRAGGKAYSSIASAMRVWMGRLRKGA